MRLQRGARRPATRGRLGYSLVARSRRGGGPHALHEVTERGTVRWRLVGGKILGSSTTAERWMRRARAVEAGLTDVVARRWGRATTRCGGARRRPHRREGRWCLRLAPGAAGEDERGEGGSKMGNGCELVGLTGGGGGDGDGSGRKCAGEGRGGLVAVGGREVSREGRWRRERDTWTWMRGMGRKAGHAVVDVRFMAAWWRGGGKGQGSISVPRGGRERERVRLIERSVQQRPGRGAAWPHHASGR
jgi:hypothetical protein